MKNKWWLYFVVGTIIAGSGFVATNPQLQQTILNQFGTRYMLSTNPQQVPNAVVCNVPIGHLTASTQDIIKRDPHTFCLWGDPPVLGDDGKWPITNARAKYDNDLLARVANDILICQVPCSNANAHEIQWCNDLSNLPPQQSFSIRAQGIC